LVTTCDKRGLAAYHHITVHGLIPPAETNSAVFVLEEKSKE
jgi:hypothetical protein